MMHGILALARKHRVPVMVHIESTRMRELSALLEAFPDVPVIWAHGGYTPLFLARRMLERHPNLTYELSARTWPRHPRSPDYTILRDGRRSGRNGWADRIEAGAFHRRHRCQPALAKQRGDEVRQRPDLPAPAEPRRARAVARGTCFGWSSRPLRTKKPWSVLTSHGTTPSSRPQRRRRVALSLRQNKLP